MLSNSNNEALIDKKRQYEWTKSREKRNSIITMCVMEQALIIRSISLFSFQFYLCLAFLFTMSWNVSQYICYQNISVMKIEMQSQPHPQLTHKRSKVNWKRRSNNVSSFSFSLKWRYRFFSWCSNWKLNSNVMKIEDIRKEDEQSPWESFMGIFI